MQQALYRKYRPKSFGDILGQDHITKVLQGALKNDNISHAYLFAGSRGTGKTSIARIFAHELGSSDNDIHEIDAASNRGIDDIRALREAVNTLPFESKYKVYIIDEVHMLTKDAFNALLKTLEEPPKHVIFMLATTELDKVLDTVISRCQVFTFKKPSQAILREMIMMLSKKEGVSLEQASADLIALLGDGSFRDAQGILQKVLSFSSDKKISQDEVESVTGAPSGILVNDFLVSLAEGDITASLKNLEMAVDSNIDMQTFLKLVLHKMRLVLLLRFAKEMNEQIKEEVSDIDFAILEELAGTKGKNINSQMLHRFLEVYDQIGSSYIKQLPIELALMELPEMRAK